VIGGTPQVEGEENKDSENKEKEKENQEKKAEDKIEEEKKPEEKPKKKANFSFIKKKELRIIHQILQIKKSKIQIINLLLMMMIYPN
jgi:hypothetical protein